MPITDPPDTLRHHQSRVLTSHRDMSHVPVGAVSAMLAKFMEDTPTKNTNPESEALWFYGMNHGMALIAQNFDPLQPLGKAELVFTQLYHQKMTEKAARAFYYLILICTREARHCSNMATAKVKIAEECGQVMSKFMVSGQGEQGIHNNLLAAPPATGIGNYVKCLQWMFYNCSWPGGYGGKAWGKVTDCLVNFVTGTFTAEMMLDTIWTLSHNNGPIFNKGHLYGGHSGYLIRLLDIQRSGQIPTAVLQDQKISGFADLELTGLMEGLVSKYDLPKYVDWYTVEALGSVKKYTGDKKAQVDKYGVPEHAAESEKQAAKAAKEASKKAEAAAAAAQAQAELEAAEFKKTHFEVYPGFAVKKLQRAA